MTGRVAAFTPLGAAALLLCHCAGLAAQTLVAQLPRVEVISVTPRPGLGIPRDQVPANVQTATDADLARRHALDLSS